MSQVLYRFLKQASNHCGQAGIAGPRRLQEIQALLDSAAGAVSTYFRGKDRAFQTSEVGVLKKRAERKSGEI